MLWLSGVRYDGWGGMEFGSNQMGSSTVNVHSMCHIGYYYLCDWLAYMVSVDVRMRCGRYLL